MGKHNKHSEDEVNQEQPDLKEVEELVVEETIEDIEDLDASLMDRIKELEERLLRQAADADNIRKRSARELEEMKKYSISSFVKDLIETVDNMYRATELIEKAEIVAEGPAKGIYDGIKLARDGMMKMLEKHDVRRIYPIGDSFDHNLHQAIGQVSKEGVEPDTVAEVLQAGYTLHDRLLRPALVMVVQ